MFKTTVIVLYGILATLYALFLMMPLTQFLVNDAGDLVYLAPLLWLTIPVSAGGVWYFFLKTKKVKE